MKWDENRTRRCRRIWKMKKVGCAGKEYLSGYLCQQLPEHNP
jgi:hypothetical protein